LAARLLYGRPRRRIQGNKDPRTWRRLHFSFDVQKERGVGQIQRIAADAVVLEPTSVQADSALITMVLHHADDPAGILHNVARFVPSGAPVVIGEFHPDGPCLGGPTREYRLAPEKIQQWCERAGLLVVGYRRQTPEHYVVVTHAP
jgi:hypothetical protein